MIDDIRISLKKVLEEEILKIYKKYNWQPKFNVIEDLPGDRILIRFRIGFTDFMFADSLRHLDPNYLSFWISRFEEEFLKCEESIMITEKQKEFIARAEKLSGKKFTGTTKADASEYAKQFFKEVNDTYKTKGCYPTEAHTVLGYGNIEKLWKQRQEAWEEYNEKNK